MQAAIFLPRTLTQLRSYQRIRSREVACRGISVLIFTSPAVTSTHSGDPIISNCPAAFSFTS